VNRVTRPASLLCASVLGALLLAGCRGATRAETAGRKIVKVAPVDRRGVLLPAPTKEAGDGDEAAEQWVRPCEAGSPEHHQAEGALRDLSKAIHDLPPTGDPKPLVERIVELEASRCFEIGDDDLLENVDSALALKTFWSQGADTALASRLEWGKRKDRWLWQPPSMRKTLTIETSLRAAFAPTHPLSSLLCPAIAVLDPAARPACGAETAGWMLRAENAFRNHASARRAQFLDLSPMPSMPKTYAACREAAEGASDANAFVTFVECMRETDEGQDALPLGKFRAPKDGWLVLRGRRGHHAWCDEIRAYDLATGTAYVVAGCGAMFFVRSPRQSSNAGITVEKGRLPIEPLREAAWMMFLANTAEHDVTVTGSGRYIPDNIVVQKPSGHGRGLHLSGFGSSSGRTTLTYQWVRQGKSVATGTVSWPDADRAADEHATELLSIAEAGFVRGCAPVVMPSIPWAARLNKTTRVGDPDDYFPENDDDGFKLLEEEITKAGSKRPVCSP
jgi:hypothetical protein